MEQPTEQRAGRHYGSTDLLHMKGAALDELFRKSPAGEVPDGKGRGTVLVAPGTFIAGFMASLLYVIAWRGKVVDRADASLLNIVSPFGLKAVKAKIYRDGSWVDGSECIVLDYSKTSFVARWIRDEIREVSPGVFLGIVFGGKRRLGYFALAFPTR
jgi:hypothetical protein